jgi:hypothetical protein
MASTVLFLDFDGVTHPEPSHEKGYFSQLDLIIDVLLRYRSVEVVISSSWRMQHSLAELRDFLFELPPHRVVGETPSIINPSPTWVPGTRPSWERQWEIETWLKENRPWGTPWIALDDRAEWFEDGCKNLLLTDKTTGFTEADALLLTRMIEERL